MNSRPTQRPDPADDLDRAYAQAHAQADDGRGPSATVRANVLAAARELAAAAAASVAAGASAPLTPVAPPVAAVGRRRSPAVNRSSWRLRSGAAVCVVLLVGLVSWRFDASRRLNGDVQVASAAKAELQAAAVPPPPGAAPPVPDVGPPAADNASAERVPGPGPAEPASRGQDLVVAQAEPPDRARREPPRAEVRREARRSQPAAAPPAGVEMSAPLVVADAAPADLPAPNRATAPAFARAPAPAPVAPQAAASGTHSAVASVAAPAARAAASDETAVAAAEPVQRVAITGSGIRRVSGEASKRALPAALVGVGARLLPMPLQAAADRGDVEALKRLLVDPATRVDAPDADGRTALLHAVLAQQAAAVRLLLAAGADPGRADQAGLTPRAAAQTRANAEIAALLATPR